MLKEPFASYNGLYFLMVTQVNMSGKSVTLAVCGYIF